MEPLELHLDRDAKVLVPAERLANIARELRYRALLLGLCGTSFRYDGKRYICILMFDEATGHLKLFVAIDHRSWFDAVRHWFLGPA